MGYFCQIIKHFMRKMMKMKSVSSHSDGRSGNKPAAPPRMMSHSRTVSRTGRDRPPPPLRTISASNAESIMTRGSIKQALPSMAGSCSIYK